MLWTLLTRSSGTGSSGTGSSGTGNLFISSNRFFTLKEVEEKENWEKSCVLLVFNVSDKNEDGNI